MLELATALGEPDVQGPTALTLALLAADESVGATMLGGGGLRALGVLLRRPTTTPCGARRAPHAAVCAQGRPARVVQAFTCRPRDGAPTTSSFSASRRCFRRARRPPATSCGWRCLARSTRPLLSIVHTSRAAVARFEAFALAMLNQGGDEGKRELAARSRAAARDLALCGGSPEAAPPRRAQCVSELEDAGRGARVLPDATRACSVHRRGRAQPNGLSRDDGRRRRAQICRRDTRPPRQPRRGGARAHPHRTRNPNPGPDPSPSPDASLDKEVRAGRWTRTRTRRASICCGGLRQSLCRDTAEMHAAGRRGLGAAPRSSS